MKAAPMNLSWRAGPLAIAALCVSAAGGLGCGTQADTWNGGSSGATSSSSGAAGAGSSGAGGSSGGQPGSSSSSSDAGPSVLIGDATVSTSSGGGDASSVTTGLTPAVGGEPAPDCVGCAFPPTGAPACPTTAPAIKIVYPNDTAVCSCRRTSTSFCAMDAVRASIPKLRGRLLAVDAEPGDGLAHRHEVRRADDRHADGHPGDAVGRLRSDHRSVLVEHARRRQSRAQQPDQRHGARHDGRRVRVDVDQQHPHVDRRAGPSRALTIIGSRRSPPTASAARSSRRSSVTLPRRSKT